jgi:hypothetical protein
MPKKDCAMIGVLMSLVLILGSIGVACSAEPASPPPQSDSLPSSLPWIEPDAEIPADFRTYTDDTKLFSISYPSDWQTAPDLIAGFEEKAKVAISDIQAGLPVEEPIAIFIAGNRITAGGYGIDPSVNIVVEPILEQMPEGVSVLDQMVEVDVVRTKKEPLQDYMEFSRVKTTINGREAAIVDCEGIPPPPAGKRHYVMMITLAGKTAWRVTCSSTAEDFATCEKDLNAIVRTLRISD